MTSKLFVYGIFLDESMRKRYFMENPEYATVKDFVTYGSHIVTAYKQEGAGLALTGLLVDMPSYIYKGNEAIDNWARLDALEGGYHRIKIKTENGIEAYTYAGENYGTQESNSVSVEAGREEPVRS